ncbi:MAG: LysM peptidoglycan-binding domain-containing protein [Ruminococcaceae bacterium]|nr:LysM peptidoglycan-binding domain-containing protein [Oscillospiraceae bacterium]
MTIHRVQRGETVYSIAERYGVSADALISDNELSDPSRLAVGQTLVILFPDVVHTVTEGETLTEVASRYGVDVNTLLRNNTSLDGLSLIYPGQTLVISYRGEKRGSLSTNGYAYPFADRAVLRKTMPFLAYFTPFTYGFRPDGTLLNDGLIYKNEDERPLIAIAKAYGTKPLMHVSTLDESGTFSSSLAVELLQNAEASARLSDGIVANMTALGYDGVDVDFEYLPVEARDLYTAFLADLRRKCNEAGGILVTALAPKTSSDQRGLLYEGHDYGGIGAASDFVLLMTYEWGYTYGPPLAVAPIRNVERVVDYALTEIPAEKIYMGIPNYGYDFSLPYVKGESKARSLSNVEAVNLAVETGSEIVFDEQSASPFFRYTRDGIEHEVWFEDAESIERKLALAFAKGLYGCSWWNVMKYFPQNWLVLNALYNIR